MYVPFCHTVQDMLKNIVFVIFEKTTFVLTKQRPHFQLEQA